MTNFTKGQKVKIVSKERGVIYGTYEGEIIGMHELRDTNGKLHVSKACVSPSSFGLMHADYEPLVSCL